MQNQQNNIDHPKVKSRLNSLRNNLKLIPELTQRTQKLNEKLQTRRRRTSSISSKPQSLQDYTDKQQSCPMDNISEEQQQRCSKFFDAFELQQKIGQGCNACVYKCHHRPSKRVYAAKKIKLEEEHIVNMKKDFITLKELNHPNICSYKGLYFEQGERLAFLVMEHVPFPSLDQYQISNQMELKNIVSQLIDAIEYLHQKNICHRDIKPSNILYDERSKKIKLIDFGVSKKTFLRGARRDMLSIIGTHFYLAPEVYLFGGYNQRIDLWAIGITIYKLVTGETPFESEYHSQTQSNILKGQFKFSYNKWAKYSPYIKSFVTQLLKRVDERMTLSEAKTHLWLQQSDSPTRCRLRRNSSHSILVNQDFHKEFKQRQNNAQAKEEGEVLQTSRMFKRINTLMASNYEFQDSDDEDNIVSPAVSSEQKQNMEWKKSFSTQCSGSNFYDLEKAFIKD